MNISPPDLLRTISKKNRIRAVAGMLALGLWMLAGAQTCRSDLNGEPQVNGADLAILLSDWGFCPATIGSVTPSQGATQGGTVSAMPTVASGE